MTKQKLIEYLKQFPDDIEIWLSSDEEGNSYLPLRVAADWLKVTEHGYDEFYDIHADKVGEKVIILCP
jgi:hypothetical protein